MRSQNLHKKRDDKNLYPPNIENEDLSIVGLNTNFDEPINPWLTIDTDTCNANEVEKIAWEKIQTIDWLYKYQSNQHPLN